MSVSQTLDKIQLRFLDKPSSGRVGMFSYDIIWFLQASTRQPYCISLQAEQNQLLLLCICFLRVWKCFCIIPPGLKRQLLRFSLGCVENCAVQSLWCHPEFQCTLQLSLHSMCNTWKWRFPFSDSIMIWQTVSKMLKGQSWLLYGRGMWRQMATVLYTAEIDL